MTAFYVFPPTTGMRTINIPQRGPTNNGYGSGNSGNMPPALIVNKIVRT